MKSMVVVGEGFLSEKMSNLLLTAGYEAETMPVGEELEAYLRDNSRIAVVFDIGGSGREIMAMIEDLRKMYWSNPFIAIIDIEHIEIAQNRLGHLENLLILGKPIYSQSFIEAINEFIDVTETWISAELGRREFARCQISHNVVFQVLTAGEEKSGEVIGKEKGTIKDISSGGLRLVSSRGVERLSQMDVELPLSPNESINLSGQARWVKEIDPENYTYGVKFTDVDEKNRLLLSEYFSLGGLH